MSNDQKAIEVPVYLSVKQCKRNGYWDPSIITVVGVRNSAEPEPWDAPVWILYDDGTVSPRESDEEFHVAQFSAIARMLQEAWDRHATTTRDAG